MHLVERAKNFMVFTGAEWVLWLLIAASLASLTIIVERWLALRTVRAGVEQLRADLLEGLRIGGFDSARLRIGGHRHPAVQILLRGMSGEEKSTTSKGAEEAMAAESIAQRRALEKRFSFLATLGANAPFIGLFGTVVGILQAFEALGKSSGPGQAAAMLAPQAVMSSIAEALVATAVGLAVAIPAVFAYNLFQRTIKSAFDDAQMLSLEVLSHLDSRELADKPRLSAIPSSKSPLSLSHAAA